MHKVIVVIVLLVALSIFTFLFPSAGVTGMAIGGTGTSSHWVLLGVLFVLTACFLSVHVLVKRS